MDIIKGNESVTLINNGKVLEFSLSKLNFLKLSLTNENNDEVWINEVFEVEKKDTEIYNKIENLFFSYGDDVSFDTEGDFLFLKKEEDKYKFLFLSNLRRDKTDRLSCEFIDYTEENSSMEHLFFDLQEIKPAINNENIKTLSKKIK